jgi:hypothetical protein
MSGGLSSLSPFTGTFKARYFLFRSPDPTCEGQPRSAELFFSSHRWQIHPSDRAANMIPLFPRRGQQFRRQHYRYGFVGTNGGWREAG